MKTFERWILHPFLFGAYPVVALLAYNIKQIGPMYAIRPLLAALLLASLYLLLLRLILKDWHKAALATSLAMLLFFSYGHVSNLLHSFKAAGAISKNSTLGSLWAILLITGTWLIAWKVKSPRRWSGPLNLLALILVGFSLFQVGLYEVNTRLAIQRVQSTHSSSIASQLHPSSGRSLPDIYYIIPEDYTRSDGLQQAFGYDNSAFLSSLEQKGFFVASCSQANYSSSDASIAASLNMNFLDTLSSQLTSPNPNLNDLYPYIQDNAVLETLKDLGYRFISFQTGYPPTEFPNADLYLSSQTDIQNLQLFGGLTAFESIFFQTTGLDLFYQIHFFPRQLENSLFDAAYLLDRGRILYELDKLADVPLLPGPKFVFVHLLAPHNPFVFGPNGEILRRNTPFTFNDDLDAMDFNSYKTGYDGQINYMDKLLLSDVDQILAKSSTPPIILLQSDTGSGRAPDWDLAELNTYYLPNGGERSLYTSISPVNSFRVVFNTYFGGNLATLPDRACDSPRNDPYSCTIKADPNPQCAAPAKP